MIDRSREGNQTIYSDPPLLVSITIVATIGVRIRLLVMVDGATGLSVVFDCDIS